MLLLIVGATLTGVYLVDWFIDQGEVYRRVFHPVLKDKDTGPEWQHLVQALIVILGVPIAYLLWHWRDENSRAQIENARKDTNLREFQELQLRAAGGVGSDGDPAVAQTLQIAALHQMRAFLRGDYGDGFRRPAFELYCALLSRPREVIVRSGRAEDEGQSDAEDQSEERLHPLAAPVYHAIRSIVAEDWEPFFRSGFSVQHRSFRDLTLSEVNLSDLMFAGCDFSGNVWTAVSATSNFAGCQFAGLVAEHVWFDNAALNGAKFNDAYFDQCTFRDAYVSDTRATSVIFRTCVFENTRFLRGKFSKLSLLDCRLEGANLSETEVSSINVDDSTFDADTKLFDFTVMSGTRSDGFGGYTYTLLEAPALEKWLAKGAQQSSKAAAPQNDLPVR